MTGPLDMEPVPLRWEVWAPGFGRHYLLATFLLEDDARAWLATHEKAGTWVRAEVRERAQG